MKTIKSFLLLALVAAGSIPSALAGGGAEDTPRDPAARTVAVSILPQAYFVSRIAGDRFSPVVLVGRGQSPHSYEPTPRQIAGLASSAAWFVIGVEFEKGILPKIEAAYPKLTIVDIAEGARVRPLETHSHDGEEAEAEPEGGDDPHIWLGRQGALTMAANVRDALSELDPAGAASYAENYREFAADIDAVFDSLAESLAPLRGKTAFVYHPAFGYFLDEFGIVQEAVETGGKEPTQKQLVELITEARADGAKVIFVQTQFPSTAAKTVAEAIGGTVVAIDDLAPDWLENLKRLGEEMGRAIR